MSYKDIIGVIAFDTGEGTIGIVYGSNIKILKTVRSLVPRKHNQGGWSQQRFENLRKEAINEYLKKISKEINSLFVKRNIQYILIGGSGNIKLKLVKSELLDYRLRDKIVSIVDVGYTGYQGIKEILMKSVDKIKSNRYLKEKQIYDNFFSRIIKNDAKVIYGYDEIMASLENGRLDTIILSSNFADITQIKQKCMKYKTKIKVISKETEEGESFNKTFGGIGGIKRF